MIEAIRSRLLRGAALTGAVACACLLPPAGTGAAPSCRGAAAFAPGNGCPSPAAAPHDPAATEPALACIGLRVAAPKGACWFPSQPRPRPKPTIALIGDSHAGSWRSVISPLTGSWGRRAVSFTKVSCSFARVQRRYLSPEQMAACNAWADRVTAWLRRHRSVRTVFFINSSTYDFAPGPGQTEFERGVEGYRAAFDALPRSVRRLVVIRDNPHMRPDTPACVDRAAAEGRPAGTACALPRDEALRPDPATEAARRSRRGAQTVDLSRFFCDAELCYPVIGGVRVYGDSQHITRQYGLTLWPYFRAELARLAAGAAGRPERPSA